MKLLPIILIPSLLFSVSLAAVQGHTAENSPSPVQVKIGTILATNKSDEFDARLKPLEKQLKVMKYRSYRLLKEDTQIVSWQGHATFEVPGGRSLSVTPQELRNRQIALKVRLLEGEKPLLDTTVRLTNRGNFILGGPPHEGGVLVLLISASTQ